MAAQCMAAIALVVAMVVSAFFFVYSLPACDLGRSWRGYVCTAQFLSAVRARRLVASSPLPSAQACPKKKLMRTNERTTERTKERT